MAKKAIITSSTTETKTATVKQFLKSLPKGCNTVAQIVLAADAGYTRKQLIDAGFNKNTVYRQVREKSCMA